MSARSNPRIAVVLTVIVIAFAVVLARWIRERTRREVIASESQDIRRWKAADYIPVADEQQIRSFLNSQVDQNAAWLNGQERASLENEFFLFLRAYSSTWFQDFKAFRFPIQPTPQNGRWAEHSLAYMSKTLSNSSGPATLLQHPLSIIHDVWEENLTNSMQLALSKNLPCEGCWGEICGPAITVRVFWYTNAVPNIQSFMRSDHDRYVEHVYMSSTQGPIFMYKPSINELQRRHGGIAVAYFRVLIRSNQTSFTYPVYLSLHWWPETAEWIPDELGIGIAGRNEDTYLF